LQIDDQQRVGGLQLHHSQFGTTPGRRRVCRVPFRESGRGSAGRSVDSSA
jgi:hypothetical protein